METLIKPREHPTALDFKDFELVGVNGVTEGWNAYPHSMEFFEGNLFVGTTRAALCILKRKGRVLPPPPFSCWPIKCPYPEDPKIMRAQILKFNMKSRTWTKLWDSPYHVDEEGKTFAREMAYRGMTTYQGKSDPKPCLYVGSLSTWGAKILRSEDGVTFKECPGKLPGTSVRTLWPFRGKLYTSCVGIAGRDANESKNACVMESVDPAKGIWRDVSLPSFGDPSNVSFFDIADFNDHLYVTTMNINSGFQLWKSKLEGKPPYKWTKVITAGAYRGFLNEFGLSLCAFGDALYVGTGIAGGGYDRFHKIGLGPAELIRVFPDDSWDLVAGVPRVTPDGVKMPISGLGPGIDTFMNGYIWRMCVHNGWLYIGTFNWPAFFKYNPHGLSKTPPETRKFYEKLLPGNSIERFMDTYGGCHLWRTQDGRNLYPVTRNGFENIYNAGIRRFVSTPHGMFVGTVNQFGPEVAIKRGDEWVYENNPRGGIEIFLGNKDSTPQEEVERIVLNSPHTRQKNLRDKQFRDCKSDFERRINLFLYAAYLEEALDDPGYQRIGYWKGSEKTISGACNSLVDRSLKLLPNENAGSVLDVECGKGGSTHRLNSHFPGKVVGVDQLLMHIDFASNRFPDNPCYFMRPTELDFPDNSFDSVFCYESMPFMKTRKLFLKEVSRVLKPGGVLIATDMFFDRKATRINKGMYRQNHVRSLEDYEKVYEMAGLKLDKCEDLTFETVMPFSRVATSLMTQKYRARKLSEEEFGRGMAFLSRFLLFVRRYLMVSAFKK
ncbi:MAG: class I SAM-dependent methyltransferase [Verrucomicrobiota bacterium]